ncbi:MAG: hypothetical protein IKK33_09300 [Lachnospiraceae bacterium]|nr:hypothetical protein [Lachnospiraceae bacterium]
MVSYKDSSQRGYRLESDVFDLHKELERSYLEALYEAKDMIAELINDVKRKEI